VLPFLDIWRQSKRPGYAGLDAMVCSSRHGSGLIAFIGEEELINE
jgi:hypothetical protein